MNYSRPILRKGGKDDPRGQWTGISGRYLSGEHSDYSSCAYVEQFRCAIVQLPAGKPARNPYEYVTRSLSFDPKKSSFTTFLETVLDPMVVEGLVDQYQLGVTKAGDVIFF